MLPDSQFFFDTNIYELTNMNAITEIIRKTISNAEMLWIFKYTQIDLLNFKTLKTPRAVAKCIRLF